MLVSLLVWLVVVTLLIMLLVMVVGDGVVASNVVECSVSDDDGKKRLELKDRTFYAF